MNKIRIIVTVKLHGWVDRSEYVDIEISEDDIKSLAEDKAYELHNYPAAEADDLRIIIE